MMFLDNVPSVSTAIKIYCLAWCLSCMVSGLHAQESEKPPIFFEVEAGAERFGDASVRSVFPAGFNIKAGAAFAFGEEWRLRLRPHAGVKFFFNQLGDGVTEQLRMIKVGGQVSYDLFYAGQTTFFPYLSADFNWLANYDAESDGGVGDLENIAFSDNYLSGSGFSPEVGMRIQFGEWYVKLGYEFFNPRMKVRKSIIDEDLDSGYVTPVSHQFNFNTINISVGATLGL